MPDSSSNPQAVAVIPARYASTRFPGKVLTDLAGKTMIERVVERTRRARKIGRVLVATDDERVADVVRAFGGEAVLTRSDHRSGTERLAEVAAQREAPVYVNVQGDEPLVDPGTIDGLISAMIEDDSVRIATPCSAITIPGDIMDPNIVKVVRDFDGNALYFSRAPIPWVRDRVEVDVSRRRARLDGQLVGLTATEFDLLVCLLAAPGVVRTRDELLSEVWGYRDGSGTRTVDSHVRAVRRKVGADVIRTVHGIGYAGADGS